MRLLSEFMSVPEINGGTTKNNELNKKIIPAITKDNDSIENRNLQLAKQQERYKGELVSALSKLPATALWLNTSYEHSSTKAEQEEDSLIPTEMSSFLNEIRLSFNAARQQHSENSSKTALPSTAKQSLKRVVEEFPFAFEDLKTQVNILLYVYTLRVNQHKDMEFAKNIADRKSATVISNRLNQLVSGDKKRLNHILVNDLKASIDDTFLFLPLNEMAILVNDIILAEHFWLSYRQQLATANTKLVLFIANQYKGNFLDFEDLVQEGSSGLLKAVDRYKYRLGFQFSTYAGYWIRQAISRALSRSERVVRIPCGQIATINRVYRAKDELTLKTGVEPTIQALAAHTNLSIDEVNTILSISQSSVALEGYDDEEDSFSPIDFLEQNVFTHPFNTIADKQLTTLVNAAIKTLNAREAKILCSHFGIGNDRQMTLQEIGTELNLTRERIRQIQSVALDKIKLRFGEQLLNFL